MPVKSNLSHSRPPKVIIIGGGPAGAACALELRRLRAADVTIVDRATYPRRKVCGSGLSPWALSQLDHLGMLDVLRPLHVEMSALRAIGPSGLELMVHGAAGAWVVPRTELDHRLVEAAASGGATLMEGTAVEEILCAPDGSARAVRTHQGELEADLIVVATGTPSTFELDEHPRNGIRTIMGWWRGRLPEPTTPIMVWDARLDGYYAWAFPEPNDVVNIGLTIAEDHERAHHLRDLFAEILDDHFRSIVDTAEPIGRLAGHPATVTTRIGKVVTPRQIFVGEAARLVCPGTVEGIAFALESGRLAAATIADSYHPDHGLGLVGQQRYRLGLATHMLPKFLVGEALHRVMRSSLLRERLAGFGNPQRLARGLSKLLGERPAAA
jgi:flavin-dependent dehydrogenase